MADTKISSLTETPNLEDAYLAAALSGTSYKLNLGQLIRNSLLVGCDIAKALVGYQRKLNTFYDGYKAKDGCTGNTDPTNGSVNTTSGYVGPTSAAASQITMTGLTTIGDFDTRLSAFTDGTTSQANAAASSKQGSNTANAYVGKDLGSGVTKKIDHVVVYPSNDSGFVGGGITNLTINLRGNTSAPASRTDGTLLGTTGAIADTTSAQTINVSDMTAYRYVWVEFVATSGTDIWFVAEWQLFERGAANNMTLVTTTQTADATATFGRVLLEIDPVDSITLNTDLTAEVTCDNGAHWASGTLTSVGKGQAGRTIVETGDTSVGANTGTSFAVRVKTLNNKVVNIYKLSMTVH